MTATDQDHLTQASSYNDGGVSADSGRLDPARRLRAAADVADRIGGTQPLALEQTQRADTSAAALLGLVEETAAALEEAELEAIGHLRAAGAGWSEIAAARGWGNSRAAERRAQKRYTSLRARVPGYIPPLAPTLAAHTDRARRLVDALDGPASPFTAAAAADVLGAVLLAAAGAGGDAQAWSWLSEDGVDGAAAALAQRSDAESLRALDRIAEHARDHASVRQALADLARRALGEQTPAVLDEGEVPARAGGAR